MKNAGVWGGIIVLIYSVVMFFSSRSLEYYNKLGPGPGFFPTWLSVLLFIISVLYIWESIKKEVISTTEMLPKEKKARQGIISTIAGILIFLLATPYIGFIIPCTAMIFTMLIRDYKWHKALVASVIASFLLLIIFKEFLGVDIPVNEYGW